MQTIRDQIKLELDHIYDSGENRVRIEEMITVLLSNAIKDFAMTEAYSLPVNRSQRRDYIDNYIKYQLNEKEHSNISDKSK